MVMKDQMEMTMKNGSMMMMDMKAKNMMIMKLLDHILQPTMYEDIKQMGKEWSMEMNMDKYMYPDMVKKFMDCYKMGMLPRGEMFVHSNELHVEQGIMAYSLLYFAKDFDVFIRTACWMRDRINPGMFMDVMMCAVLHREDCNGIILPALYETYPYFFIESSIMNKALMMKMTKSAMDPSLMDYYGIKMIPDMNMMMIDSRPGTRHVLCEEDRLAYFYEDIDLNNYMFNLVATYPSFMYNSSYGVSMHRKGEIMMYTYQQLIARLKMERLSHEMCDINALMWEKPMKCGYWPKIRTHLGDEMPMRQNDKYLVSDENIMSKRVLDDMEAVIRESVLKGMFESIDGTMIPLKKTEDYEMLCRMVFDNTIMRQNNKKLDDMTHWFLRILSYSQYNMDKYTYIPGALDMYSTCLRDPLFWKVMKRIVEIGMLYKNLLPSYTREEFDFPGVKIESFEVDKLVTFMDEYDIDITNGMFLNEMEMKMKKPEMIMAVRQRRMNHQPFKITMDVKSDKTVDAIVRVFIGPKYDCMGSMMSMNDKRLDMFEIDTFLYSLQAGKNTIVRDSMNMHGMMKDRPWTRYLFDRLENTTMEGQMYENMWYKSRYGFPSRLLLPMGKMGGLPLQMYVIISPVRSGLLHPKVDMMEMKKGKNCRWSTCMDTMPLGFPFDRHIDMTEFYTPNMKFKDVMVYMKDMALSNMVKQDDLSDMIMKRDDMTYLDTDMLMKQSYKDTMKMSRSHKLGMSHMNMDNMMPMDQTMMSKYDKNMMDKGHITSMDGMMSKDKMMGMEHMMGKDQMMGMEHMMGKDQMMGMEHMMGKDQMMGMEHMMGKDQMMGMEHTMGKDHIMSKDNVMGMEHMMGKDHVMDMEHMKHKDDMMGMGM